MSKEEPNEKEIEAVFSDLYTAIRNIQHYTGLSMASILGSMMHAYERDLIEGNVWQDPKENTSTKYTVN